MIEPATSLLACVLWVAAPTTDNPRAGEMAEFNLELTAKMEADFLDTIPWSKYAFVSEPENQREFVVEIRSSGEKTGQIIRLSSDGPAYSTFAPFKIRVGDISDAGNDRYTFEQTAKGTCRIVPISTSRKEVRP